MSSTQTSKSKESSSSASTTGQDSIQDPLATAKAPARTDSTDALAASTSGVQGLTVPLPGIVNAMSSPSAVAAVNANFDWSQHPARSVIEKRVKDINARYPDIDVTWVIDWVKEYIDNIYKDSDDAVFQTLSAQLAARINSTNPAARGDGTPAQKGLSGGTGTQLWTGAGQYQPAQKKAGDRAKELLASGQEAGSVESTLAGELMDSLKICKAEDDWSPKTNEMWTALSKQFAENARGNVEVHTVYGVRKPSVFYTTESIALMKTFAAQEQLTQIGLPLTGNQLTSVQMHIYMRKGQEQDPVTNKWRLKPEPDTVEDLVHNRTESITNSADLEAKRADAWDKDRAKDPYFAVVPG